MTRTKVDPKSIYQLKVTLKDINPPIWRRILVSPSTSLFQLHDILQLAMGWMDSHLHEFTKDETHYQPPEEDAESEYVNSKTALLGRVLTAPGDKMEYLYDFGDGWEHEIILEQVRTTEPGRKYPYCADGERACPPEDCGSIPGYQDLVEAMGSPKHPDRKKFIEWLEGTYDPEEFDLALVNSDLEDIENAWYRIPKS